MHHGNFMSQTGNKDAIMKQAANASCSLVVKQYGSFSVAGNVGRTGSAKINQDSVFVSKITYDGRALTTKE